MHYTTIKWKLQGNNLGICNYESKNLMVKIVHFRQKTAYRNQAPKAVDLTSAVAGVIPTTQGK